MQPQLASALHAHSESRASWAEPDLVLGAGVSRPAEQLQCLHWLTAVEHLNLAGSCANASTLMALRGLSQLHSLCLDRTAITDEALPHLQSLQSSLAALSLNSTPITGETMTAQHWGVVLLQLSMWSFSIESWSLCILQQAV